MGKPKIERNVQLRVYRQYRSKIFEENGKIKPYSDKIFITLMKELAGMTKKSIHVSIARNAVDILSDITNQVSSFIKPVTHICMCFNSGIPFFLLTTIRL